MDSSVCNINLQMPVLLEPSVLPDIINPDLTQAQQEKLRDTLRSFSGVFSQQSYDWKDTPDHTQNCNYM